MQGILIRLIAVALMELVLALVGAPGFVQVFPLALLVWVIFDIAVNSRVIKVQMPLKIPKDLQKQLEKQAKKQLKDIEKGLQNSNAQKTDEEQK